MSKSQIYINTIFRWCNDVDPIRHFYTDLLGLEETYYRNDEEHGWLTYKIGDTQLVFTRASSPLPVEAEWAKAPAYQGGTKELESWVMAVNKDNYQTIVQGIKASDALIYDGELEREELLLMVKDPMGFTIELWLETDDD